MSGDKFYDGGEGGLGGGLGDGGDDLLPDGINTNIAHTLLAAGRRTFALASGAISGAAKGISSAVSAGAAKVSGGIDALKQKAGFDKSPSPEKSLSQNLRPELGGRRDMSGGEKSPDNPGLAEEIGGPARCDALCEVDAAQISNIIPTSGIYAAIRQQQQLQH